MLPDPDGAGWRFTGPRLHPARHGAIWRERLCILIVRLKVAHHNLVADMDTRSNFGAAKILCVEFDSGLLKSRCGVLKYSGYDAASASPQVAEIMLRSRKFDLIVLSKLSDFDLHRIINLADGADVLVLDGFASPSELLSLVAQRLDHRRKA
jgi:hypothetical protein